MSSCYNVHILESLPLRAVCHFTLQVICSSALPSEHQSNFIAMPPLSSSCVIGAGTEGKPNSVKFVDSLSSAHCMENLSR